MNLHRACTVRRVLWTLPALGVLVWTWAMPGSMCHAQSTTLVGFEIEDQFGLLHTDSDVRGALLLVVGADQKGSSYQGDWVGALRDSTRTGDGASDVQLVEVADLRGVPFFLKGSVKRKFPTDRRLWVLMDWKGAFARAYGFESQKCNVLLFDRAGNMRYRIAAQQFDGGALEEIVAAIDAARAAGETSIPSR